MLSLVYGDWIGCCAAYMCGGILSAMLVAGVGTYDSNE